MNEKKVLSDTNKFKCTEVDILVDLSDWHLCLVVQCTRMGTEQGEQFLPGMKKSHSDRMGFCFAVSFYFPTESLYQFVSQKIT